MINRLVQLSIRQRVLVLITTAALFVWGVLSFLNLPIEAYPDVMNTQVQLDTQWPGHAAEEMEKQVSIPIESSLNGIPGIQSLRSRSLFGLSSVYLTFKDGVDDYFAREQVLERIAAVTLPNGIQPQINPLSSATGEICRYTVTGAPLTKLKEIQDWTLVREFKAIPGVADDSSFGGTIKQYQIEIDPLKLRAGGVTLSQVETAITNANSNGGGGYIERGSEEYVVRGLGLLKNIHDIGQVIVTEQGGTPLRVGDLANIRIGYQPRLGKVGWRPGGGSAATDNDDVVEGTLLLLRGAAPGPVLDAIHEKIHALNNGGLPKGVRILEFSDRSNLVHTTTRTVEHNLIEGVCLVVAVLFLFLGNVRASVITALTIPFGLLFAFSIMNLIHVPANLLSLGAIDFGVIVNGSVILVESIYRRLARRGVHESVAACILTATGEVESEIVFTTLIIILAYLPLFTMQGVEKKMFAPLAYTIGLALAGSLVMAILVVPVLCFLFLRGKIVDREPKPFHWLKARYQSGLESAVVNPVPTLVAGLALFAVSMAVVPRLGSEFLPHLDEGNLWIRATMPDTISYSEAERLVPRLRAIMAHYQPSRIVVSQLGRPDDGTDATGFYNAEFLVDLKPYDTWKGYKNKEALISAMNAELSSIPGVSFNFSQNIEDNVEEAVTGVKGELAVKLFGDDLMVLEAKAAEIQKQLSGIKGVVDLTTFTETGEPQVQIDIDRVKCSRYGVNISDVQDMVQTGIGGQAFTQILEGEKQFGVTLRLPPEYRTDFEKIRDIQVSTADGYHIPLSAVTNVHLDKGAAFIYRENNRRFIAIKFGVRGRDLAGTVQAAQAIVAKRVILPPGYHTEWGGEFESLQRANARLAVILPITLLLIFLVLFLLFDGAVSRALIVMINVPLSLSGAILALYFAHFHLSVSAAVGFIALFGVAVQNGVIMVSYFDHLRARGEAFRGVVLEGAATRLRPVLMTAMLATIGLVPAALSTGIGSDTQKPLAIAIIGGLVTATPATLFILPVLYSIFGRARRSAAGDRDDIAAELHSDLTAGE